MRATGSFWIAIVALGCASETVGHGDVPDGAADAGREVGPAGSGGTAGTGDATVVDAVADGEASVSTPVDAADAAHDTATAVDAGVDAGGPIETLSCTALDRAWHAYVERNRGCTKDEECAAFEDYDGASTCDVPPGLAAVVSSTAVVGARPYAKRYFEVRCGGDPFGPLQPGAWTDSEVDGSPFLRIRCEQGLCTGDRDSCLGTPPDAALP